MATATATRRIVQSTGIVMASMLASRVLGFFREWMVAHQIGSNAVTDAFYAAFTLPDFLNYLVAAGALSLNFIPVFSQYLAENREAEGWHVFSTIITVMGSALVVLMVVAEIFAPQLVAVIAPGFAPAEKARVVFLTRLMLPAQICFYLGSILVAVQYTKGRFGVPSLAPVIYNTAIIVCGVTLSSRIGITGFAVGVLVGAFTGNFLLQVYGAYRAGARFSPNLDVRHPGFRLFIKLTIPIMLALSLATTDNWIIRWFGSYLPPASITWLTYAKGLMHVPLALVGGAVGVASFPVFSQLYSEGKIAELNRTLNLTLKAVIALLVPVSALTIAQTTPLVYFVFSRTRLRSPDLEAIAATLAFFAIGMFGWGAQNILARGFYATRHTAIPAAAGTVCTFLNLPLYWLLARHYQHLGLALASSCGMIAYTIALFILLNRRTANGEAWDLVAFFLKVSLASALAGLASFGLVRWLESRVPWQTTHGAFLVLVLASTVGVLLTAIFAKMLRVSEVDESLKRFSHLRSKRRGAI